MIQKISSNATSPECIHPPTGIQTSGKIKVAVHIPAGMAENIKQQKINRIYDILNPGTPN